MNELRIGGLAIRLPIIQGGMGVGISLSVLHLLSQIRVVSELFHVLVLVFCIKT